MSPRRPVRFASSLLALAMLALPTRAGAVDRDKPRAASPAIARTPVEG